MKMKTFDIIYLIIIQLATDVFIFIGIYGLVFKKDMFIASMVVIFLGVLGNIVLYKLYRICRNEWYYIQRRSVYVTKKTANSREMLSKSGLESEKLQQKLKRPIVDGGGFANVKKKINQRKKK